MVIYRGVEQLVARQAHNLEVACSSRVSATFLTSNMLNSKAFGRFPIFLIWEKIGSVKN